MYVDIDKLLLCKFFVLFTFFIAFDLFVRSFNTLCKEIDRILIIFFFFDLKSGWKMNKPTLCLGHSRVMPLFIPRHTIVVGLYGFMLDVRVSVCQSVCISFPDDNLSRHQWIFTKLGMCIDIVEIWFGIANGRISSNFDRVICQRQAHIFKNGTYYVTGYGIHPFVNFLVSGWLLLQFTSSQAETWCIDRPWCGAAHIVSRLQSTKCLQSYAPLKISVNFSYWVNSYISHPTKLKCHV